ncbi:MAG: DEAD/DEAH box helicase family protein [Acidimicrobiales bacterium]|jgi:superfamily II DNA or RNA helicase|nr:DEAD/DEAH box helicase family protein [Acidimicrobiales bacterium]
MRYELMDYQRSAAIEVLDRLERARSDWSNGYRSSFALSAITGSGKTVIATAVVEALLFGSADLGVDPDPQATFLWITDDPALNRQTRNRMLTASDLLAPRALVEIDDGFLNPALDPGRVYFLNIQKLSKKSRLVQSGTNLRQASFWEVLASTIANGKTTLHLILDEAHRGMKQASDRKTIVQRLIHGEPGSNPPVPTVWGISATIDRFTKAMGQTTDRTRYPDVEVAIDQVRASGLVKDEIGLEQPDEKGTFSTTLLRDAVKATRTFEQRWAAYSVAEGEPEVLPALVVQVPDKANEAKLTEMVSVIESEWPDLDSDAIAHVFGEHEPIVLGSRTIDWVPAESIQGDTDIRVVLAKEAISTGWDCPRAEVLYSERPASDATHIAQVIGRMVRQPLAHRIATDDVLNSVTCYLPLFDSKKLAAIKDELEGNGADAQHEVGPLVVRAPMVFDRNPNLDPEVFEFLETLPSIPTPDPSASPLRRAKNLVRLLADDGTGPALVPDADALLTKRLNARLDGLAAEYADAVDAQIEDLRTAIVRREGVDPVGQTAEVTSRLLETHIKDLDRDTRKILNSVREGVGKGYYAHRVAKADPEESRLNIRVHVAALLRVDGVIASVEVAATEFVQEHLATFSVEISNTTGATRDAYRKVQEQTGAPEAVTIELRANDKAATKNGNGADLPTFGGHLYSDADGQYPADLNDWETKVVTTETNRPSFVAWYRNPSRATPNALRIAYRNDAGAWSSLQVDFVIVSRRDDGSLAASIVDPHGDHLADAKCKLRALADFAEAHGNRYIRVVSVAKGSDGSLRVLDLLEPGVREAVRDFDGAQVSALYDSAVAVPYL